MMAIPTYIINLAKRSDRRAHILKEFANKPEFKVQLIKAIENKNGALGLWQTITHIIKYLAPQEADYILICEDDHQFTKRYNVSFLKDCIFKAQEKNADILLGGVSWYKSAVQVSPSLFWVDRFTGLQFTVVFCKFFQTILEANFESHDAADLKISDLTNNKLVIYPYISIQKEFGYSDVTTHNNADGYVSDIFKKSLAVMQQVVKVKKFYERNNNKSNIDEVDYDNIVMPAYVISQPDKIGELEHIKKQFAQRSEFDLIIVNACECNLEGVGLWNTVVKIIKSAMKMEEDVIVISTAQHMFTEDYSKTFLLKNIIEAHSQGVDILSGGSNFESIVLLTPERYWINPLLSTDFIVVYSKIFDKILSYRYKPLDTVANILSELTSHKMLLFPFISSLNNSNVTYSKNVMIGEDGETKGATTFYETHNRIKMIQRAEIKYNTLIKETCKA